MSYNNVYIYLNHVLTDWVVLLPLSCLCQLFMSDAGIHIILICVERYEWTVCFRRTGADDAKGRSALWGLGTPGITQPVRLLPGERALLAYVHTGPTLLLFPFERQAKTVFWVSLLRFSLFFFHPWKQVKLVICQHNFNGKRCIMAKKYSQK